MSNFKNKLINYQSIPRDLIFDNCISDRARFLFVYMASKPEDWDFYVVPMAKELGYSTETLRKYISELISAGWLIKKQQAVDSKGVFCATEYEILDQKLSNCCKPVMEKTRHGKNPSRKKPVTEKTRDGKNLIHTYIDNNIKEINTDKDKEEKDVVPTPPPSLRIDFEKLILFFNENRGNMPKIQIISEPRKIRIKNLIKNYSKEKLMEVILLANTSNFMQGDNARNWIADFDWITQPKNFIKILEGSYKNKENGTGPTPTIGRNRNR